MVFRLCRFLTFPKMKLEYSIQKKGVRKKIRVSAHCDMPPQKAEFLPTLLPKPAMAEYHARDSLAQLLTINHHHAPPIIDHIEHAYMQGASTSSQPLTAQVKLHVTADGLPPSHHVLAPAPGTTLSSYLPHWNPQPATSSQEHRQESHQSAQTQSDDYASNITCLPNSIALVDSHKVVRTGFHNPWKSWHKPTVAEVWQGLEWGEDHDPAIDYAMQDAHLTSSPASSPSSALEGYGHVLAEPYRDSRPSTPDLGEAPSSARRSRSRPSRRESKGPNSSGYFTQQNVPSTAPYTRQQQIKMACKQLLTVQSPCFDFDSDAKLKATWLGHAGVLVQLPSLSPKGEPIRVLFDPIFSQRCSPTQVAGPTRSYPAPCSISSLPPIDLVIISHNHYDHLDHHTIDRLWAANKDRIRFIVPLGNKEWFVGAHKHSEAELHPTPTNTTSATSTTAASSTWSLASTSVTNATTTSNLPILPERVTELDWWDEVLLSQPGDDEDQQLRIVCTPAQHGSGRYGVDTNCALWSSWFLEHPGRGGSRAPTKLFFGGDTGCQFHGPSFPPPPPRPAESDNVKRSFSPFRRSRSRARSSSRDRFRISSPFTSRPHSRAVSRDQSRNASRNSSPAPIHRLPRVDDIAERVAERLRLDQTPTPTSETSSINDDASTIAGLPSQSARPAPVYRGGVSLKLEADEPDPYPPCPAFEEIVARLGTPDFLMLPISVGATISFLRSYIPLPDSVSPFPRISPGLTAANHMPPWDAVSVFDKMTTNASQQPQRAVCMAIHWGTFISGPEEVLKTLGQLKWACVQHGVGFARSDEALLKTRGRSRRGRGDQKTFVALNHGASITL